MGVSPEMALQIAAHIDPFDRVLNTVVASRSRLNIRRTILNACTVKTQRHRITRHLERVSLTLNTTRVRFAESLPVNTPARKLNIPLIMFLVRYLNYTDKKPPYDLVKGMGISGSAQPAESLTKRRLLPTSSLRLPKSNLVARSRNIARHLKRVQNPTLKIKRWELPMAEHGKKVVV